MSMYQKIGLYNANTNKHTDNDAGESVAPVVYPDDCDTKDHRLISDLS